MSAFPIIVYGDGKLFREYFNAIVGFFGTSNFSSLLNMSLALATFTICYSYISKRKLIVLLKWFGLFYVSVYMLFTPRTSVVIIDRVDGNMQYIVDHVPFGLAWVASYTSLIGDALTQSIESNFTMPDYMPYHETGMVFASRLVSMATQFEVSDAKFDANLQEFIHQCVFYDILLNKYSINDLIDTPHLWDFIASYASPARAFIYNEKVTTCRDGVKNLTTDWHDAVESSLQQYSHRIYPQLSAEKAKTRIQQDLPMSYRYLTDVSASASEIVQQNLMANAIQRGVVGMGAKLDAAAALQSYTFERTQEQKRLTNQTMGEMAAYWLPLIKIALEAIIYGAFIFIVLLSVFPFGGMVLRNYVYSLLWIHSWAPLYAIINLIVSYHAQSTSIAAVNGGFSLKSMSGLLQINSDMAGLAGYLSMTVPFLATGLIAGLHKGLAQGVQFDGGVTQSALSGAVNEAVTGNMSFGNTSFGNQNAFNNTANHVDTSGRVSAGMTTSQLAGGSSLSVSADGTHIMDMRNALSNLGTSINFTDGLRKSYTEQAERATTAGMGENLTYSQAANASLREMADIGHHLSKSSASGDSWTVSNNAAVAQALSENDKLIEDYASRHNLSFHDAANVLANAYVDGKVSGEAGAGVGGGMMPAHAKLGASAAGGLSRSAGHTTGTDKGSSYSDAQSYIHDTNYGKNVDLVSRATRDHSFRLNSEEGNRAMENMAASFDRAESARHDMQNHYQEAQTARENAARVEEQAASIQVNGTQEFADWIANQPGTNGQGRLGYKSVEAIQKDPHMAEHYANQFMKQYKAELESNWNKDLVSTKEGIHDQYQTNSQYAKAASNVRSGYEHDRERVVKQAHQEGLISQHTVDNTPQTQADKMIFENSMKIANAQSQVLQQGQHQKEKVMKEESRPRHKGLTHDLIHGIDTTDYK